MMSKCLAWLLGSLSLTIAHPALCQVAVVDASILGEDRDRDEALGNLKDTEGRRYSVSKGLSCAHYRPGRAGDAASAAEANPEIVARARQIAREHALDEELFLALIYQESRFNACARSPAGAIGLTQLMPGTAAELGVNPYDIDGNLRGGARYLKQQLSSFGGNTSLALAAYNAGPGSVQTYGGIPPFRETRSYVAEIQQKWLPEFGGATESGTPVSVGGGSASFNQLRVTTLSAMGTSNAISAGSAEVAGFWVGLGSRSTASIHDSWDHNSKSRNANLEMINQAIAIGQTITALINSRRAIEASGLSGSAYSSRPKRTSPDGDTRPDGACLMLPGDTGDGTEEGCRAAAASAENTGLLLSSR